MPPPNEASRPTTTRRVAIFGATGSIGTQTLDVLRSLRRVDAATDWQISAVSCHRRAGQLAQLIGDLDPLPGRMIVTDPASTDNPNWRRGVPAGCEITTGQDALMAAATDRETDTVVAAIVGRAGLESTLAAVRCGKRVALANKETLVVAGPIVTAEAKANGAEILPVDSEHAAIWQCLQTATPTTAGIAESRPTCLVGVRRVVLTASGGPFRGWSTDQMDAATVDQALAHPTWEMGRKISIDSATMMNKALEIIEARWLFDLPAEKIAVVVHPQSLIHSWVEFDDGSVVAQISPPDMRLPIQSALTSPRRLASPAAAIDPAVPWEMTIEPADPERFPALALGFEVAAAGGTAGAVLNGANEAAVDLFLRAKIRFTDIAMLCRRVLHAHDHDSSPTLSRLIEIEDWSRREVAMMV